MSAAARVLGAKMLAVYTNSLKQQMRYLCGSRRRVFHSAEGMFCAAAVDMPSVVMDEMSSVAAEELSSVLAEKMP